MPRTLIHSWSLPVTFLRDSSVPLRSDPHFQEFLFPSLDRTWKVLGVAMPICTSCATPTPYLYTVYDSAYNFRLEQCVSALLSSLQLLIMRLLCPLCDPILLLIITLLAFT